MPPEILKRAEFGFFSGEMPLPKTYRSLGSSASGGAVGPGDVEFRVLGRHAPEPERVAVRPSD